MAAYAAPQQSYASNDILTASPGRLVVLLYDGAGRFFRQASAAMRAGALTRHIHLGEKRTVRRHRR